MSLSYGTFTCVNEECAFVGEKVYAPGQCRACHGELFSWDDVDIKEVLDLDDDNFDILNYQVPVNGYSQAPARAERPVESDTFSVPADFGKPIVRIPAKMFDQWISLARRIHTEWIAYLIGTQEGQVFTITSMYFPKQLVTPTHCEAEDGEILPGTIAAVHSHVGMGVFFSGEDEKHMNHPIEMVINNRGEIKANGLLACGHHRGEATVQLIENDELLALEDDLNSKMERDRPRFRDDSKEYKEILAEGRSGELFSINHHRH